MRRLSVFVRPYWRKIAVVIALLFGAALAELAPPYLVSRAIDGPIAHGDIAGVTPIFALYVGALLLSFACRYAQTYIMQSTGQQVMVDIRMTIFSHIQRMSLSFFDRNPVGRLLTRLTNDVDALNEFISQGMVALLGDGSRLIFIIITMLLINWRLALISFAVLPFVIIATVFFQRVMRSSFRQVRQRLARINAYLNEQITGILVTQLFNREELSRIRFAELSRDYRAAQYRSLMAFSVFFPTVSFLSICASALLLNLGGPVVLAGFATLGTLVAFIQYTDQTFGPIRQIAENYNTLQSAMASSERIFRILDTEEDVRDAEQPQHLAKPVRGEIAFNNVWFSYNAEGAAAAQGDPSAHANWVLRGLSFSIPPGQSVAIVGATGAGKTSLVSLLARFYDIQRGSITLDGVNIRDLPQRELRRHISAVPQDPVCFSGTVASNIRLHDSSISDDQVYRAAQVANAHPFIERLPGGYEFEVRERGSNLSVGQRQLLAFARAIAFNPEVLLILDEATSSVDTETESLIQEGLERLLHGRTSIVIAHRLSTIRHVDRIIVLHKGKIVEDGSHDELLAQQGYYHRLYQLQFAEQAAQRDLSQRETT
ncbi:ABC transporter ATP-binding protein [Chloroflexia bacterium SDU3-3]|nr:ABC transporter ATP-binding protein [Chloroflexia bacterium SDU3-3]